jgi:hypothetical protein
VSAISSAAASPVATRSGLYQGGPWHVEQGCSIRRIEPHLSYDSDEEMPEATAVSSPAVSRSAILARGPRREASSESSSSSADYSAFLLFHRLSLEALDVSTSTDSRDVSRTELSSDLSYVSTVPTSAGGSDDENEPDKEEVAPRRNTILPSIKIVASSPWPAHATSSFTPQIVPACSEPVDSDEEECDVCERPQSRCPNYACLLQGLEMLQSDVFAGESSEPPTPASPVDEAMATPPATALPERTSSEACVSAMLGSTRCTHGLPAGRDCGDPTCEGCGAIFFNATPGSDASSSGEAVLDFLAATSAPSTAAATTSAAPRPSRKRSSASAGIELAASTSDKTVKGERDAALAARRDEWISRMRGQTRFYGSEKRKESRRSAPSAPSLLHSGPTGGVNLKHGELDAVVIAAPRTLAAARGPVLRSVQPKAPRAPLPQLHPVSFLPGATMSDLFAGDAVQPTPKSASLLYETKVYHRACATPCPEPPLARFALHKPAQQRSSPSEAEKAALARKKKPTSVLRLLR